MPPYGIRCPRCVGNDIRDVDGRAEAANPEPSSNYRFGVSFSCVEQIRGPCFLAVSSPQRTTGGMTIAQSDTRPSASFSFRSKTRKLSAHRRIPSVSLVVVEKAE